MSYSHHPIAWTLLVVASLLLLAPTGTAAAAGAYDEALERHLTVDKPFLKENEAKLVSSSYEFGKYLAQYFGAPPAVFDAVDYAKVAASERDIAPGALARYMMKRYAAANPTTMGNHLFARLDDPQRAQLAEKLAAFGFEKGADPAAFQHKLASVFAGVGEDEAQSSAAADVIVQTMIQFNPSFAVAYSGYRLAAEGYKELDRWISNETTRAMFKDLQQWDPDASHPENRDVTLILEQRSFDEAELEEPRRLLAKLHSQSGKPTPTDLEVKHFILKQYDAWTIEKQQRAEEEPLLRRAKAYFESLKDFEKRKMFGEGDEPDLAEAFVEEYMKVYRTLMQWKGDKPWPAGGRQWVENLAFDLLKRKLDNYADEPWKYEDWLFDQMQIIGWAKRFDEAKIVSASNSIAKLMVASPEKIDTMAGQMGIVLSEQLRKCLCAGGQWYQGGRCHFVGSLGGEHSVPVDHATAAACLARSFDGDQKSFAQRVLEWPERRDGFGYTSN